MSPFHSFFPCTHALSRWAHKVKRPLSLSLSLSLAASLGSGRAGLTRMTWFLNVSWKFRSKKNTQGKGTKRKTQKDLFFLFFFFLFLFSQRGLRRIYATRFRPVVFYFFQLSATLLPLSLSLLSLSLSFALQVHRAFRLAFLVVHSFTDSLIQKP